ncbi:exopolysaccharide biosynthesis polyprenyl glycosylphosphotransferase [Streptomyces sp. SCSIO ZS0520]|uniref:exopolysaccharide biosynthesis polyprenyl glycosylphosphotransferase n=1 Tax=Streptomyces sp. SCSIO ZS0520 TaxID=2892996 RepID=UPI0021D96226|nr:exopolysaccharide biosynthesis polyprenyl glycosylphosphotransferase [Streptomyces sp. SCSIO ZS0520]
MTAESTVPPPAGRPRGETAAPGSASRSSLALAPRPVAGKPLGGTGRSPDRRWGGRPPLLLVDVLAALVSSVLLGGPAARPLPTALLVATAALAHARAPRRTGPAPGALEELPAVFLRAAVCWCLTAALLAALAPARALSLATLGTALALHTALGFAGRALLARLRTRAALAHPRAALVIGESGAAQQVAAAILRHPRTGLRPVGLVGAPDTEAADEHEERPGTEPPRLPVLNSPEEIRRAVVQNGVRAALVVGADTCVTRQQLLTQLDEFGCELWRIDTAGGYAPATGHRLAAFPCELLAPVRGARLSLAKRSLDVAVSALALLALSPLLGLCAGVLRLTDGPGVVFRQERIGRDGRPFTLLKFRTYRPADAEESATRWSVAGEARISLFCRFLRSTSLDELLQLVNVLRGDMSLVGPRPERPYFVAEFSRLHPGYAARHRLPVGITGLAQINGLRGDTSIEDRARFDNAYIETWSLWGDVCILLRTVSSLLRRTGS